MLDFIKKRYGIIVSILLILLFGFYIFYDSQKMRLYPETFSFADLYVNVKIYEKNPARAKKALQEIKKIYNKYEKLIVEKEGNHTEAYIQNNQIEEKKVEIDPTLYNVLSYAKKIYNKNNKYTILKDGVELLQKYPKEEVPKEALETLKSMEELNFPSTNTIENNHLHIDIRFLSLAFANQEVKKYSEKENLSSYLVNASGMMLIGKHYGTGKYKIGLEDSSHTYYKNLELENSTLATTGESVQSFTYNGQKYAGWIDPDTHKPVDTFKNVTVIGKDPLTIHSLSQILYFLSIEEGKQFLKDFSFTEVIWQKQNGEVVSYQNMQKAT